MQSTVASSALLAPPNRTLPALKIQRASLRLVQEEPSSSVTTRRGDEATLEAQPRATTSVPSTDRSRPRPRMKTSHQNLQKFIAVE